MASKPKPKPDIYDEIIVHLSTIIPQDQSNMSTDEKQSRKATALQLLNHISGTSYQISNRYTDAVSKRLLHFESKGLTPTTKQYPSVRDLYELSNLVALDNEFWSCKVHHSLGTMNNYYWIDRLEFVKEEFKQDERTSYAEGKFYCWECWFGWDGYMIEKDYSKYGSTDSFKICPHKYDKHKDMIDLKETADAELDHVKQRLSNIFAEADMKIGDFEGLQKIFNAKAPRCSTQYFYIRTYQSQITDFAKYVDHIPDNIAFVKDLIKDGYWDFIPDRPVCSVTAEYRKDPLYYQNHPCECSGGWNSHQYSHRVICSKAYLLANAHEFGSPSNYHAPKTLTSYKKLYSDSKTNIVNLIKSYQFDRYYSNGSSETDYLDSIFGHHMLYMFLCAERKKRQQLLITDIDRTPSFDYFYSYLTDEVKDIKHTEFYQDLSRLTPDTMSVYLDNLAERDDVKNFRLVSPLIIQHFTSASFVSKLIGEKKTIDEAKIRESQSSEILQHLYENGIMFQCPDHMLVKLIKFDVKLYKRRNVKLYYLTSNYNDLNIIWEDQDLSFTDKFDIMCSWCFRIMSYAGTNIDPIESSQYQLADSPTDSMADGLGYLQSVLGITDICNIITDHLFEPTKLYVNKRHRYLCEWIKLVDSYNSSVSMFRGTLTVDLHTVRFNPEHNLYMDRWITSRISKSIQNAALEKYTNAKVLLTELEAMTEFDDKDKFNLQFVQCIQIFTQTIKNLPHLHCNDERKRIDVVADRAEAYWLKKEISNLKIKLVEIEERFARWKSNREKFKKDLRYRPNFIEEITHMEETFGKAQSECEEELKRIESIYNQIKEIINQNVQILVNQLNDKLIESGMTLDNCIELKKRTVVFDDKSSLDTFLKEFTKFKSWIDKTIDNMDSVLSLPGFDLV